MKKTNMIILVAAGVLTAFGFQNCSPLGFSATAASTAGSAETTGTQASIPVDEPASTPAVSTPVESPPAAAECSPNSARPSTLQLMNTLRIDSSTASDLLYGVIGSNVDTRDWNAILSSPDPLAAARAATAALYSGAYCRSGGAHKAPYQAGGELMEEVLRVGHFAAIRVISTSPTRYLVYLVDHEGYFLTSQYDRYINFGFNAADLQELRRQASNIGIQLN